LGEDGSVRGAPLRYDCVVGAQCRLVQLRMNWTLLLLLDQLQLLYGEESPLFVNNSREVSNEASVKAGTSSQVKTRIKVKAEIVRIGNSSPARTRILAFQTRTRTGRFSPARTKAENKGYFLNRAQVPTKSPALTSRSPTSAPALKLSKTLALAPDNTNSPLVNLQPARATRLWKQLRMLRPCLVLNPSSL